jgi:hypothetical protein
MKTNGKGRVNTAVVIETYQIEQSTIEEGMLMMTSDHHQSLSLYHHIDNNTSRNTYKTNHVCIDTIEATVEAQQMDKRADKK